jgi:transposase
MRKRCYRSTTVKQVKISGVLEQLAPGRVTVGLDVGKTEIFCVLRDATGHFERPWKAKNPSEIPLLVEQLQTLSGERELVVAMESTGTYGDALRQALSDAHLAIHRVSGKASKDYAEIFDGVPSAHDGKDAAVIAELVAIGKSTPWPTTEKPEEASELHATVLWLDTQQKILQQWLGRLEALMARHWPEVTRLLKLRSGTLLRTLAHYGGSAALVADDQAATRLAKWGRHYLKQTKIEAVIESARQTVGVRLDEPTAEFIQRCAKAALAARSEIRQAQRTLVDLTKNDPVVQAQAPAIGITAACVARTMLGDPRDFHCGEAYRKAMGLNLKERSSGRHQGQLKLTKRGPGIVRRWLYLAALRLLQQSPVRRWYEAKKKRDGRGQRAVVAVMRKLALAMHAVVTRNEPFDLARLFPGKPRPVTANPA